LILHCTIEGIDLLLSGSFQLLFTWILHESEAFICKIQVLNRLLVICMISLILKRKHLYSFTVFEINGWKVLEDNKINGTLNLEL
jgi:hypothetical protein